MYNVPRSDDSRIERGPQHGRTSVSQILTQTGGSECQLICARSREPVAYMTGTYLDGVGDWTPGSSPITVTAVDSDWKLDYKCYPTWRSHPVAAAHSYRLLDGRVVRWNISFLLGDSFTVALDGAPLRVWVDEAYYEVPLASGKLRFVDALVARGRWMHPRLMRRALHHATRQHDRNFPDTLMALIAEYALAPAEYAADGHIVLADSLEPDTRVAVPNKGALNYLVVGAYRPQVTEASITTVDGTKCALVVPNLSPLCVAQT